MKKIISLILAVFVIGSACVSAFAAPSDLISIEEAKSIALEHAGFNVADVDFIKAKLDFDDGIYEYEIEFRSGNAEYDYSINAENGRISDFDYDVERRDFFEFGLFIRWFSDFFKKIFKR